MPPIAIYDTDAPLDKVAEFYAQSYGYNKVAPDATNNLSSAKPPAYYRTGDLAKDVAGNRSGRAEAEPEARSVESGRDVPRRGDRSEAEPSARDDPAAVLRRLDVADGRPHADHDDAVMSARRALIAGLGLIGGSIGLALRRRGWHVAFFDSDPNLDPGEAADERVASLDADADVVILATPVDVAMHAPRLRPRSAHHLGVQRDGAASRRR